MSNKDIPWPPQSPQDVLRLTPQKPKPALLSSPSHPSPLRNLIRDSPSRKEMKKDATLERSDSDDDDESDEELLKLKLARIEAKLKLKKLEKLKRKRADSGAGTSDEPLPTTDIVNNAPQLPPPSQPLPRPAPVVPNGRNSVTTAPQVLVPHSPEKRPPPSPSRITLGLDKGLKGKDISLRRAPSLRTGDPIAGVKRETMTRPKPSGTTANNDPFSGRPSSGAAERQGPPTRPAVKTFNQRIAEARAAEHVKVTRQVAIERSRSKGFGISLEAKEEQSISSTQGAVGAPLSSFEAERLGIKVEEQNQPDLPAGSTSRSRISHSRSNSTSTIPNSSSFSSTTSSATRPSTSTDPNNISGGFESFSQIHLSTRTLPHPTLARALNQKTIYLLPDLLKAVVSPDYDPPDIEGDYVVMGIISSKSEPRQTTKGVSNSKSSDSKAGGEKYMVMQLTDLKWDIELFLFSGGFERFWKVGVGTVVAILNPGIMKPRDPDSGKFSLCLSSAEDTLLEIGYSRDLGFCKSIKKDGKRCTNYVDKRKMEYCIYHIERVLQKSANQRMELNNMGKLFEPPSKRDGNDRGSRFLRRARSTRKEVGTESMKDDGLLAEGPLPDLPQRAGGAGGRVFILPPRDTNALLDDSFADAFHVGSKEERMRRQLAKSAREREIARKLVASQRQGTSQGNVPLSNTGSEYLRIALEQQKLEEEEETEKRNQNASSNASSNNNSSNNIGLSASSHLRRTTSTKPPRNNEDYTSLLPRSRCSANISLSSIKRKRPRATNTSKTVPVVGSAATATLPNLIKSTSTPVMRPPVGADKDKGSDRDSSSPQPPVKKRTRFCFNNGLGVVKEEGESPYSASSGNGSGNTPVVGDGEAKVKMVELDSTDDELEII